MRQTIGPLETDRLIAALSDPGILEIIRQHGDMDRPAGVVKELLKQPALYRYSGMALRCGIKMLTVNPG